MFKDFKNVSAGRNFWKDPGFWSIMKKETPFYGKGSSCEKSGSFEHRRSKRENGKILGSFEISGGTML